MSESTNQNQINTRCACCEDLPYRAELPHVYPGVVAASAPTLLKTLGQHTVPAAGHAMQEMWIGGDEGHEPHVSVLRAVGRGGELRKLPQDYEAAEVGVALACLCAV